MRLEHDLKQALQRISEDESRYESRLSRLEREKKQAIDKQEEYKSEIKRVNLFSCNGERTKGNRSM